MKRKPKIRDMFGNLVKVGTKIVCHGSENEYEIVKTYKKPGFRSSWRAEGRMIKQNTPRIMAGLGDIVVFDSFNNSEVIR